jgi:trehalose 6-phosphate phosphatase
MPEIDWAWFFDVDGTLVELAATPSGVVVHHDLAPAIKRLHKLTGGAVSLITGRAISDVDRFLFLPGVPVAGQHGLEVRSSSGSLVSKPVRAGALHAIRRSLDEAAARHSGLIVEPKGNSIALHYRLAPRLAPYAHKLVRSLRDQLAPDFLIQKGKRVVELKPAGADKGEVIREIMATEPFRNRTPVFIGDDLTDEAGFLAVNEMSGYSVKVGRGPSNANFRLGSVDHVRKWIVAAIEHLK